jgi:hypothetical protein
MPTVGEKVAALEVSVNVLTDSHRELRETVKLGFEQVARSIEKISPNGETPNLVALSKDFTPAKREVLNQMIGAHKVRTAIKRPFGRLLSALTYGLSGAGALALLHFAATGTWF